MNKVTRDCAEQQEPQKKYIACVLDNRNDFDFSGAAVFLTKETALQWLDDVSEEIYSSTTPHLFEIAKEIPLKSKSIKISQPKVTRKKFSIKK